MAAVARIKADGARISPAGVLAQVKQQAEFADVTLSQVRRAITAAPKADAEVKAQRRAGQKRAHDVQRDRSERARPAEDEAKRQRHELEQETAVAEQAHADRLVLTSLETRAAEAARY